MENKQFTWLVHMNMFMSHPVLFSFAMKLHQSLFTLLYNYSII